MGSGTNSQNCYFGKNVFVNKYSEDFCIRIASDWISRSIWIN